MSSKPNSKAPPRLPVTRFRSLSRRFILGSIAVALIPFALYGAYMVSRVSTASGIEERIRARGEPVTLAELAESVPKVPDDQNAALALIDVWRTNDPSYWNSVLAGSIPSVPAMASDADPRLPLLGKNGAQLPRGGPLPEEMLELIAAHVAKRAAHRAAISKAIERPQAAFPIRYEAGPDALLPHLSAIRREQHEFGLEFLLALSRGELDAALGSLENVARLGNVLRDEPILISQMVRVRVYRELLEWVQRALAQGPVEAAQLARLEAIVAGLTSGEALRTGLKGDRVFAMAILDLPAERLAVLGSDSGSVPKEDSPPLWTYRVLRASGGYARDRALLLELHERLHAALDPDPVVGATRMQAIVEPELPEGRGVMLLPLTRALGKPLADAGNKFASLEARRRAALTAIAIERFRMAKQGRLPAGLDDLPPPAETSLRRDPFGDALLFKPLATGYVVYSVGPDRTDDGGQRRGGADGYLHSPDEAIRVER